MPLLLCRCTSLDSAFVIELQIDASKGDNRPNGFLLKDVELNQPRKWRSCCTIFRLNDPYRHTSSFEEQTRFNILIVSCFAR